MSIGTPCDAYNANIDRWNKINDVRSHRDLKKYLRKLTRSGAGSSLTFDDPRQEEYADGAIFYNITGYTIRGLIGTMFRRDPIFDPSPGLAYLLANCDGKGNSIHQQAKKVGGDVVALGRAALWVNYPRTEGETSRADVDRYFATIHRLKASQIIKWGMQNDGAVVKLSLIVFEYTQNTTKDYETKGEKRLKELYLDDAGEYNVREWKRGGKDESEWVPDGNVKPLDSAGRPFTEIPFTFVGAENNDSEIDDAPMYDMARVNIGHYRNSADYEDSVFYAGQSQPWMSGITDAYYDLMKKHNIRVGSRVMMPVPKGETFGFATPDPNPSVRQAMIDKVELMIGIGARFVTPGGSAKTAYEAESDREVGHSILSTITENVADAYTRALRWVGQFMGESAPEYGLDSDFTDVGSTPQLLAAWVKAYIDGAVPQYQYIGWMQRQGYFDAEQDPEQIAQALDGVSTTGAGGSDSELGED